MISAYHQAEGYEVFFSSDPFHALPSIQSTSATIKQFITWTTNPPLSRVKLIPFTDHWSLTLSLCDPQPFGIFIEGVS